MSGVIVQSEEIVTLVGGGHASTALLETLRARSKTLVAADGGARHAVAAGWMPDAVIGDLDSLDAETRAALAPDTISEVAEQDSTDFEKCLTRIAAPLVVGLGFMGPRTDHQLASFHSLMRLADRRCILLGDHQLVFLCPPRLSLPTHPGQLVSVFPLTRIVARSQGLQWPLDDVPLRPGVMVGTSNRAVASQVELECDQPGLLVILQGQELQAAMTALMQAPVPWPAHAG